MTRSWIFMMSTALAILPAVADAMPSQTTFELRLVSGPNEADATTVATVTFRFNEDVGNACRYSAGWQGTYDGAFSTACTVDELKTLHYASCIGNAAEAFTTVLVKPTRSDCAGFDTMARVLDIAALVALVEPDGPNIVGLLMFAGGFPFLYAFEAEPEN